MAPEHKVLKEMYEAFNARDIERALSGMHEDVVWANGMEGGNVHGRSGVREYWVRQWQVIDPRVDPQGFEDAGGKVIVDVHQVVRDLKGKTISDRILRHSFVLEDGLVKIFKIV